MAKFASNIFRKITTPPSSSLLVTFWQTCNPRFFPCTFWLSSLTPINKKSSIYLRLNIKYFKQSHQVPMAGEIEQAVVVGHCSFSVRSNSNLTNRFGTGSSSTSSSRSCSGFREWYTPSGLSSGKTSDMLPSTTTDDYVSWENNPAKYKYYFRQSVFRSADRESTLNTELCTKRAISC